MKELQITIPTKEDIKNFVGDLLDWEGLCFLEKYLEKGIITGKDIEEYLSGSWSWWGYFTDKHPIDEDESIEIRDKILGECPNFYDEVAEVINGYIEEILREIKEENLNEELSILLYFGDCPYADIEWIVDKIKNAG